MPLYVFKCENCGVKTEAIAAVDQTFILCEECHEEGKPPAKALKTLSTFGSYSIKGNNSASCTPKKFRGGRPS